MNLKLLGLNLVVAVGYIVCGQLGLLLAIPPSNAVAVWPAAGIALAAAIVYGARILPGLVLGIFVVQCISILDAWDLESVISIFQVASINSIGALLQAFIGARLVRSLLQRDPVLLKDRSILKFCVLAGPISCLISPSIGIASLWAQGILLVADIPLGWTAWWVGDSIGVLVMCPLLFCFIAEPRASWRLRIPSVAAPLCALIVISFFFFKFSYEQELNRLERIFEINANRFENALTDNIDANLEAALTIQTLFDATDNVSPEDFSRYARSKIVRMPALSALEWIPKITHEQRESFQAGIGAEIMDRNEGGYRIVAPAADYYLPITHIEPFQGNEKALAYNIRSNPLARSATELACASGASTVTEVLTLIQASKPVKSVVFYAPVFRRSADGFEPSANCGNLKGFAASLFKLEEEIIGIRERLKNPGISIRLSHDGKTYFDDPAGTADAPSRAVQFQFSREYAIPVANKTWTLHVSPSVGFIANYSSWVMWLVFVGGLLIAALSGVGLLMMTGRTLQMESEVRERTRDLNQTLTEKEATAMQLATENECFKLIAREASLDEILDSITTYVEEVIIDARCSVLLMDSSGEHLKHGSAPSLSREYVDVIDNSPIGPIASSCGTAAYLNNQVIVADIATDPLWEDYSEAALKHGLRACWSTPIVGANDQVLGAIALYFPAPRSAEDSITVLITRLAQIIAIAILRQRSVDQLTFQASHDALTGLINRRGFEQRAKQLLAKARREDRKHALCFVDLDQFKVINDSCGHIAGDEMLRQLSALLLEAMREKDLLARLGGDEFAILIQDCSIEEAYSICTSILGVIQNFHFGWQNQNFRVGASIGLVSIDSATPNFTELMKEADAACYTAKDSGRNRIHLYNPQDTEIALRRDEMQWVNRIDHALSHNQLCLFAQAIVPLHGQGKTHYELLLRLLDDEGNLIAPGAFLPAAERYNVIARIDAWVIEHTIDLLSRHPGFLNEIGFVSINLSAQSLANSEDLERIIFQLNNSTIDCRKICFEITETAAVLNMDKACWYITKLRETGCQFALDDFGSGFSSYGYLKDLKVNYLKIDGMFVKDIVDDEVDRALVKSINEMGHILGIETIAEFVENDKIKSMLNTLGVNYAQGYGVGKPEPLEQLINSYENDSSARVS